MNTRTTLTTLAATTIALTLTGTAGATDTRCDGNAAIHNTSITITNNTYTATWQTWDGCADTPITIAAHDTAHLNWDPTEHQPLIDSHTVPAYTGRLEWQLPAGINPRCRLQLDLVTGAPLPEVNPASRYNETAIGGTRNRLIDARYATSPCVPPSTSTSAQPTPTAPTTTAPADTTLPPVTVTRVTELPPATFPPTWPEQPGTTLPDGLDLVALTPDPTPYTLVPRLPETGAPTRNIALFGLALLIPGALAVGLARLRNRHQHGRNFTAS